MTKIGDSFTQENPEIKIEWAYEPEWRTKLTTLLAANTPPDLAFMRGDYLASVAPKGVLLELDDLVSGAGKSARILSSLFGTAVSSKANSLLCQAGSTSGTFITAKIYIPVLDWTLKNRPKRCKNFPIIQPSS